jgi:hypothetical protein
MESSLQNCKLNRARFQANNGEIVYLFVPNLTNFIVSTEDSCEYYKTPFQNQGLLRAFVGMMTLALSAVCKYQCDRQYALQPLDQRYIDEHGVCRHDRGWSG